MARTKAGDHRCLDGGADLRSRCQVRLSEGIRVEFMCRLIDGTDRETPPRIRQSFGHQFDFVGKALGQSLREGCEQYSGIRT